MQKSAVQVCLWHSFFFFLQSGINSVDACHESQQVNVHFCLMLGFIIGGSFETVLFVQISATDRTVNFFISFFCLLMTR